MKMLDGNESTLDVFIKCGNQAEEMAIVRSLFSLAGMRGIRLRGRVVLSEDVPQAVERRLVVEIEALPWQSGSTFVVRRHGLAPAQLLPTEEAYFTWLEPGEVWYADTAERLLSLLESTTGFAVGELARILTCALKAYDYAYAKVALRQSAIAGAQSQPQAEALLAGCFIARGNASELFSTEAGKIWGRDFPDKAYVQRALRARLGPPSSIVDGPICGEFEARVGTVRLEEPMPS
jgi:hypothetical protein